MTKKVYKTGIYYKALYSIMVIGLLVPGLWVLFYGIEKRSYNWPLLVIALLICLYAVYIFIKVLSYKVVMTDEYMKIYDINRNINIYYCNIIDIKIYKDVCYIIDKVSKDGIFYIRGTNPAAVYSTNSCNVNVDPSRIASIRKTYLEGYYEIIDNLLCKCGMDSINETAIAGTCKNSRKSSFIRLSLLKSADEKQLSFKEVFKVLISYLILLIIFLVSLLVFAAVRKDFVHPLLHIMVKLVFPLYVVVIIYLLVLKYIPYVKRILDANSYSNDISLKSIIVFLTVNILLASTVIALFFYTMSSFNV